MTLFQIWINGSGGDVLKIFLIWLSGSLSVQWSRTIYAILKEGIMRNIHVKLVQCFRRCRLKIFLI